MPERVDPQEVHRLGLAPHQGQQRIRISPYNDALLRISADPELWSGGEAWSSLQATLQFLNHFFNIELGFKPQQFGELMAVQISIGGGPGRMINSAIGPALASLATKGLNVAFLEASVVEAVTPPVLGSQQAP